MRHAWLSLMFLCSACWLQAQGSPELGLDVNGQAEAVVAKGWPLLIHVVVIPAGNQPLQIGLAGGAWTQALQLTITDQNGAVQHWPAQLLAPATPSLSLSGIHTAEAVWLVAPTDTSAIPNGLYSLSVALNTTTGAMAGTWSGSAQSSGATVQLGAEPGSLSSEDEASKYLALAAYARLRGDTAGVQSALDTLIGRQPDMLEAYTEKADLLAAGGDYAGALALSQQALDKFNAKHPNAAEAPVILHLRVMAMADQLAAQPRIQAGSQVTSLLAGDKVPVLTPESIASAYGTKLATGTMQTSGPPPTVLGGTTVSIQDSTGAVIPAPIYFVSSGQVNYLVPATVALGPAVITFSAGDGTVQTGKVTIANVQPGLFTLNAVALDCRQCGPADSRRPPGLRECLRRGQHGQRGGRPGRRDQRPGVSGALRNRYPPGDGGPGHGDHRKRKRPGAVQRRAGDLGRAGSDQCAGTRLAGREG